MSYLEEIRDYYPEYADLDDWTLTERIYGSIPELQDFGMDLDALGKTLGAKGDKFNRLQDRGLVSELFSAVPRILRTSTGMGLRALRTALPESVEPDILSRAITDVEEELQDPTYKYRKGQLAERPGLAKKIIGGFETFGESVIPMAVGAGAGFMVGGPFGATLGAGAAGMGVFGLAEYDQFIEEAHGLLDDKYTQKYKSLGHSDEDAKRFAVKEVDELAHPKAVRSGGFEGIFEGASNMLDMVTFRLGGKVVKALGVKNKLMKPLVRYLATVAGVGASEMPSEFATGYLQALERKEVYEQAGKKAPDPMEWGIEGAKAAGYAAPWFGLFGGVGNIRRSQGTPAEIAKEGNLTPESIDDATEKALKDQDVSEDIIDDLVGGVPIDPPIPAPTAKVPSPAEESAQVFADQDALLQSQSGAVALNQQLQTEEIERQRIAQEQSQDRAIEQELDMNKFYRRDQDIDSTLAEERALEQPVGDTALTDPIVNQFARRVQNAKTADAAYDEAVVQRDVLDEIGKANKKRSLKAKIDAIRKSLQGQTQAEAQKKLEVLREIAPELYNGITNEAEIIRPAEESGQIIERELGEIEAVRQSLKGKDLLREDLQGQIDDIETERRKELIRRALADDVDFIAWKQKEPWVDTLSEENQLKAWQRKSEQAVYSDAKSAEREENLKSIISPEPQKAATHPVIKELSAAKALGLDKRIEEPREEQDVLSELQGRAAPRLLGRQGKVVKGDKGQPADRLGRGTTVVEPEAEEGRPRGVETGRRTVSKDDRSEQEKQFAFATIPAPKDFTNVTNERTFKTLIESHPMLSKAEVKQGVGGKVFTVKLPNSKTFIIRSVEKITLTDAEKAKLGDKIPVGATISNIDGTVDIELTKLADRYHMTHELWHWLKKHQMITKAELNAVNTAMVRKNGGVRITEESQAKFIENAHLDISAQPGIIQKMMEKIRDILDGLVGLLGIKTVRKTIRDIERGTTLAREAKKPVIGKTQFATATVEDIGPQSYRTKYFGEAKPSIRSRISAALDTMKTQDFWDKQITKWLDKLHPVKRKLGMETYRLKRGATGVMATLAMLLEHGGISMDAQGVLTATGRNEGFMVFLKSLKDHKGFLYWAAATRAEELKKAGKLDKKDILYDDFHRDEIFNVNGGRAEVNPEYVEANKTLQKFNKEVLDIAQTAGLISAAEREVWEQEYYVPFHRIFENKETAEEYLNTPKDNRKNISADIHKLIGSQKKLGDPLTNILRNWAHLIDQSMQNVGQSAAVRSGVVNKEIIKVTRRFKKDKKTGRLIPLDLYYYIDLETNKQTPLPRSDFEKLLSYKENGKTVYFLTLDDALFQSLAGINPQLFNNVVMKFAGMAKRALTYSATFGPAFKVANTIRDSLHTALINKSFIPIIDTAKGFMKAMSESPEYIAFMASGFGFGSSYIRAEDPTAAAKFVDRILKKEGQSAVDRILKTPRQALAFWEKIGAASENAARVQLYSKLIKDKGFTHGEAAFESRDLLDFTMSGQGNLIQILIQNIPFLNARIQGIYKLGRSVNKDNWKNMATRASMLAGASIALWWINKDDDRWKELEDWDKWGYTHWWVGDQHYRMPNPFEVGAFAMALPVSVMDIMYGNEDTSHFADFIGHTFTETFAIGYPQLIKTPLELWANKSTFTGRPIIGTALKGLKPGQQADPWTSETLKLLGEKMNISPKKAEAIVKGYFSTIGALILGISDIIAQTAFDLPERPDRRIDDYPLLGRFMRRAAPARHTKQLGELYEMFREIDEIVKTASHYRRTGDMELARKLVRDNATILRFKIQMGSIRRRLTSINNQMKAVWRNKTMSGDAKDRRIDLLLTQRNRLVDRVYSRMK